MSEHICSTCTGKMESVIEKEMSRRDFVRVTVSGLLSIGLFRLLESSVSAAQAAGAAEIIPGSKAKSCILLFMNGGPSQLDTFDPKPGTANGGPFKAIKTSASNIQISQHLPQLADQAHHLSIIRSMSTKEGNHERARYLLHTGYPPQGGVRHPTWGSIMSYELGERDFELPKCISINSPAFDAGFLGAEHNPFVIDDPTKPIENIKLSHGIDQSRLRSRMSLLNGIEGEFAKTRKGQQLENRIAVYQKADKLIQSPMTKAFDFSDEAITLRNAYGMNRFGQGCLMARRLVETGVKFVEVSLDGWDTHQNNFTQTKNLMSILDPAFATLVRDLHERKLLESTLVIWLGEFGRTPKINMNDGRDHYPQAWSAVLAGGGVRGSQVIGSTDEAGEQIADRAVTVADFFASLCYSFGIDSSKQNVSTAGRPIRLVDNGKVVKELFNG